MFGIEGRHFVPMVGLARHTKKTMEFMDIFHNRALFNHLPGGLLLSLYNALILVVVVFAITSVF